MAIPPAAATTSLPDDSGDKVDKFASFRCSTFGAAHGVAADDSFARRVPSVGLCQQCTQRLHALGERYRLQQYTVSA